MPKHLLQLIRSGFSQHQASSCQTLWMCAIRICWGLAPYILQSQHAGTLDQTCDEGYALNEARVNSVSFMRVQGHGDIVTGFAFSPDGKAITTVADDRTLRLFRVTDITAKGMPFIKKNVTKDLAGVAFGTSAEDLAVLTKGKFPRCWAPLHAFLTADAGSTVTSTSDTVFSGAGTVPYWFCKFLCGPMGCGTVRIAWLYCMLTIESVGVTPWQT